MKQVIYSEHHRGIVEYPLLEKPIYYSGFSWNEEKEYDHSMEAYNKWLSSPPIAQVQKEFIEFFSVPRGKKEYKIEKLHVDADGNPATFYTVGYKLVAIPIKEADSKPKMKNVPDKIYLQVGDDDLFEADGDFKELSEVSWCQDKIYDSDIEYVRVKEADLEPGVQSTNEAAVASHSCAVGNSIEHGFKIEYRTLGNDYNVILQAKNLNAALLRFAKCYHEVEEIYSVRSLLNSDKNVK
jgi:hypothetical protein